MALKYVTPLSTLDRGKSCSSMTYVDRPDFGPNYTSLPPLPAINSEAIRIQVFTHRSFYGRPTHIFEDHPDDPSPDNEKCVALHVICSVPSEKSKGGLIYDLSIVIRRFEHLGDTVLGLVVTALMLEMYPGLRVGPSTVRFFVSCLACCPDLFS